MRPSNTIDPRDEQWMRECLGQEFDDDGLCFGVFGREVLGPFGCKDDAIAACDAKLAELQALGVDILAASPHMSVIFGDPATYHLPTGAATNG
jgi:hypothetical protein